MTAWHAAQTEGQMRRLQQWSIPSCAHHMYFMITHTFTRAPFMDDDQRASMASPAPHVTLKSNLHPHPMHSHPTSLHSTIPSRLPCLLHRVHPFGRKYFVDHCQCLATRAQHHITTHHNICCFVHTARNCFAYVCLPPLLRPSALLESYFW